jgi:hypothetical protein
MLTFDRLLKILMRISLGLFAFLLLLRIALPDEKLMAASYLVNIWHSLNQDLIWLGIFSAILLWLRFQPIDGTNPLNMERLFRWIVQQPRPVLKLTLLTLLITLLGVDIIYHRYSLSMDEFLLVWQAKAFLAGYLIAPIAEGWTALSKALQPMFMLYYPAQGYWTPGYGPLSAGIYALFDIIALGPWSNAVLAGISLVLTAAIAREIWPEEQQAPPLAAILLATSTQFLITAMTPYAMTGHLFVNLLWLWLFLADTPRRHVLATLVGFIACGLHQVYVHPLFILPFMLSLLAHRRFRLAIVYATAYGIIILFWISWRDLAIGWLTTGNTPTSAATVVANTNFLDHVMGLLGLMSPSNLSLWLVNVVRFVAWQSPLTLALAIPALFGLRQAPHPIRLLAWSILITLVVHGVLMPGQGHGWGYRYLHVHLGSAALIAVWGWLWARQTLSAMDRLKLARFSAVLLLAGIIIALPLRARQTEAFVHPSALAEKYIKDLPVDLVFIDVLDIWFGIDLTRNDPLLRNTPKVMTGQLATSAALQQICAGKTAVLIDYSSVAHFGMKRMPGNPIEPNEESVSLLRHLSQNGCLLKDVTL